MKIQVTTASASKCWASLFKHLALGRLFVVFLRAPSSYVANTLANTRIPTTPRISRGMRCWRILTAMVMITIATLLNNHAAQFDLASLPGGDLFGTSVTVLPNGNFVVTDPGYDFPGSDDVGAVYLFDGVTLAIISTLTGGTAGDAVGNSGVTVLSNGNYVVSSTRWNGSRGAVTWGSATTGVSGAVSAANSLVGSTPVGPVSSSVTALANGNYVVSSPSWDNGAVSNAGAVTWCSGTSAVTGAVSAANSLIGSTANSGVGSNGTGTGVIALANGNYVVVSRFWDNGAVTDVGAVTWCNGTSVVTGTVSAANSLVGSTANDQVGSGSVSVLNNGNYVVSSSQWDNGAVANVGAVTWGNGLTGVTGAVAAANSLVGSTAEDQIGASVIALSNGNYVVRSPSWHSGALANAGAATWGNGLTGVTGVVSAANSLVGSAAIEQVGNSGVIALTNGNYVVRTVAWSSARGAVTWGSGTAGVTGTISAANSLVGSTASDLVGNGGVTVLTNGNYVVRSGMWDNGAVVDAGAVTWGSGTTGVSGAVSAANSLVGNTFNEQVGAGGVVALNNGNYVVSSFGWDNGALMNAGAVTWVNGTTGLTGAISAANSLVGGAGNDQVGNFGVMALNNGNYVVRSTLWNGSRGAVTWCNGTSVVTGTVSAANSLVGSTANDQVGSSGVTALANGNYLVRSADWDNGAVTNAGAVTWCSGTTGASGAVSAANSLVGSTANDQVGSSVVTVLNDGNYVVRNQSWDNGAVVDAGATTLGDGTLGTSGAVTAANSVRGSMTNGGFSMVFTYDYLNTRILVGYPSGNRVSLFGYNPKIAVQQPLNINLANGGTRILGAPVGANGSLTFVIKNINTGDLTGLGITIDGSDAALFTVTAGPTAPVSGPLGSTAFTVQFSPTSGGVKSAAIHIASNDADENPFDINLSGQPLSFTQDTDGDGMNDAAEFELAAIGFDWQLNQTGLVNTYYSKANGAGLYTTSQVQALNVGIPLLQRNPSTGVFTLTIGVEKSTDLSTFSLFPMNAPGTSTVINGAGKLEFQFTVPDNAAFFQLRAP